ncbi:hypothetical protein [Sporolactobacillus sp. KGMB 08714]|uniref:hypothetical protein n=1 Tax=Sporolactobacillus sp. KGMB 08714 TaxID=3064704 RepID=UPI002FBE3AB9
MKKHTNLSETMPEQKLYTTYIGYSAQQINSCFLILSAGRVGWLLMRKCVSMPHDSGRVAFAAFFRLKKDSGSCGTGAKF